MLTVRKSDERGMVNHGWLLAKHSFSFANYYDPENMGYRGLRVINEDRIGPGRGFGTHPHRDMEIVTYVLEGALEHKDSMGNGSVIRPGDVQRMSAGTGVAHSEYNHSETEEVHLMQIWIEPEETSIPPSYEERRFTDDDKRNRLLPIATKDARDGSMRIYTDVHLYATVLEAGATVTFERDANRHVWIQLARGSVEVNGETLKAGDGANTSDEDVLEIKGVETAEFLLFDLA